MTPPLSYLDYSVSDYSRFVNLTTGDEYWHSDFAHAGRNVYAYLLSECSDCFDLISIQFYESYCRAVRTVELDNINGTQFLKRFSKHLQKQTNQFAIRFNEDPTTGLPTKNVTLPNSKLVWGVANGWAVNSRPKTLYISTNEIAAAWKQLPKDIRPRGIMMWTLDEEGTNGVLFAKSLAETVTSMKYEHVFTMDDQLALKQ